MNEFIVEKAMLTDVGRKRPHNEDYIGHFEPAGPEVLAESGRLYIVADGVGGGAAGEVASEYAVRKVLYEYYRAIEPDLGKRLKAAVWAANADLYDHVEQHPELNRMGTTLVAAVVHGDRLIICNVGDSRAYLIRNDDIHQVTRDHSLVARLVEEGSITPEEAETHPRRNVVLRSLGANAKVYSDIFDGRVQLGDQIVLCSDGLTRHVTDDEILGAVSRTRADRAVKQLVEIANVRGGQDNISVVLLRVTEALSLQTLAGRLAGRGAPAEPEFDDLHDAATRQQRSAPATGQPLWPWLAPLAALSGVVGLFVLATVLAVGLENPTWMPALAAGVILLLLGLFGALLAVLFIRRQRC